MNRRNREHFIDQAEQAVEREYPGSRNRLRFKSIDEDGTTRWTIDGDRLDTPLTVSPAGDIKEGDPQ
ncbi:hypothetical protein KQI63_05935 [bacterium]|nr:hypothetical protein [bacterium]